MPRIEGQIDIATGATRVFRFCHDADHRAEWDERVSRAQVLTPGPVRRGTVLRFDTDPAGSAVFSWDAEVVSFQFPSSSTLKVTDVAPSSTFVSGSEAWRFEGSGGSTRLSVVWEYEPRGIIGRVLDVLVRRRTNANVLQQSLKNVKMEMESEG